MGELIDKVKGKIKQAEGRVTGNPAREAEGVADETKGNAKGAFEDIKSDVKRAMRENEMKEEERRRAGEQPRR
jgi:uncharacterized protein YjbJ (UPF0337 family)